MRRGESLRERDLLPGSRWHCYVRNGGRLSGGIHLHGGGGLRRLHLHAHARMAWSWHVLVAVRRRLCGGLRVRVTSQRHGHGAVPARLPRQRRCGLQPPPGAHLHEAGRSGGPRSTSVRGKRAALSAGDVQRAGSGCGVVEGAGCGAGQAQRAASARSVSATRESTTGVGVAGVTLGTAGADQASCMASWR